MSPHSFIYLASQSPRRRQLLDQLGVAHRPLLADRTENAEQIEEERSGELPADYVRRVTLAKLLEARRRLARRGLPRGADPLRRHHGGRRPAHPGQAAQTPKAPRPRCGCCRAARTAC